MAIITRRYKAVGPSAADLSTFVGNGAVQNAEFGVDIVDIDVDDAVDGAVATLDEYMALRGWLFDAGATPGGPLSDLDPLTVRGPDNLPGIATEASRQDHQHRLELDGEEEGVLVASRPTLNVVGVGGTLTDDPGNDRMNLAIPGTSDGGANVSRTDYSATKVQTSGAAWLATGVTVTVPIAGDYWGIFEAEGMNQSASGELEIAMSINSLLPEVDSQRTSQGPASNMRPAVTTHFLGTLAPGDLIRGLFHKLSGAGTVELDRKRITIFLVQ
jgi:hypothetical protein